MLLYYVIKAASVRKLHFVSMISVYCGIMFSTLQCVVQLRLCED